MLYVYGMRSKPFRAGRQPIDGLQEVRTSDKAKTGYYSLLKYIRELTDKELIEFDLDYLGDE